jgi:WD40 repeat protein/serine/threonine protein kinase
MNDGMKISEPQQDQQELCSRCGSRLPRELHGLCETCLLRFSLGVGEPVPLHDDAASHSFFALLEPSLPEHVRLFGDYELIEQIGAGGMGVVWRARQKSLNRLVALKMIRAGQLARPEDVQRFRAEAEAAARLQHPGVVAIYEIGEVEGQHFFSMELIEGPTLARSLAHGPFAPRRAATLVRELALIMSYAHSRGILHRDLKPSNIVLSQPLAEASSQTLSTTSSSFPSFPSVEKISPHITDFGLAKLLESTADLTHTAAILGSPAYMSPEQATGTLVDSRADLYSLGAILYECLTGRPPFQAETPIAALRQVVEKEPPALRLLNPDIPRDLETICLKCLEKDPAKRYPTAQAFADDLQHFLQNEPITARPITRTAKLFRWSRRNPALATAYSLLTLLLILILIGSPLTIYRINQARKAEADARSRAEVQAYLSDLGLAQRLWNDDGDLDRARQLLRAHLPKPGQTDLRGFEWRYLWNLCRDESRRSFTNHDGIFHFAWTPDRKKLAVSSPHTIKFLAWDGDGHETDLITDPVDNITKFEFCPVFTNFLATGSGNGKVKLWDLNSKEPISLFTGLGGSISAVAFSADGRYLAAAGETDKKIALWDVRKRTNIWFRTTAVPSLAVIFAGDEHFLISGGGPDAGNPLIWDLEGNATPFPAEHKGWVESLVLGHGTLATGSADGTTIIWDLSTLRTLRRLNGAGGAVFSPFSKSFVLGEGSTVALWGTYWESGGGPVARFRGHGDRVTKVAFSPDGRWILSGSADRSLKIWDLGPHASMDLLTGHTNWISRLEFSPDGKLLASLNYHQPFFTRLWEVQSRTMVTDLLGPTDAALGTCFSRDGSMLATGSADRTVHIWNPVTHALLMVLPNDFLAGSLAFSRDSRILGVADAGFRPGGKCLCFWDIPSGTRLDKFKGYETDATAIAFAHHSDLVAIGYFDGAVRLWDFSREQLLCQFQSHSELVWSLVFSEDDTLLASGSQDATAAIYDVQHRRAFSALRDHSGIVWSVAFTRDGKSLATASGDSTVKLWNLITRKPALTLKGHLGAVTSVSFTPDGELMATSGADGTVRFWPAPPAANILQTTGPR